MDALQCLRFMKVLDGKADGNVHEPVKMDDLSQELGLDINQIHEIAIKLYNKGRLNIRPGRVVIMTSVGKQWIDEYNSPLA